MPLNNYALTRGFWLIIYHKYTFSPSMTGTSSEFSVWRTSLTYVLRERRIGGRIWFVICRGCLPAKNTVICRFVDETVAGPVLFPIWIISIAIYKLSTDLFMIKHIQNTKMPLHFLYNIAIIYTFKKAQFLTHLNSELNMMHNISIRHTYYTVYMTWLSNPSLQSVH